MSVRLILINILIGLLAATIAQSKGYPFFRWWINGAIGGPFSLLYVIFMKPRKTSKEEEQTLTACPNCGKMIPVGLSLCPQCQKKIDIIDV